jgi:hypothetical protein
MSFEQNTQLANRLLALLEPYGPLVSLDGEAPPVLDDGYLYLRRDGNFEGMTLYIELKGRDKINADVSLWPNDTPMVVEGKTVLLSQPRPSETVRVFGIDPSTIDGAMLRSWILKAANMIPPQGCPVFQAFLDTGYTAKSFREGTMVLNRDGVCVEVQAAPRWSYRLTVSGRVTLGSADDTNRIVAAADQAVMAQKALTRASNTESVQLAQMPNNPSDQANLLRFVLSLHDFSGGVCDTTTTHDRFTVFGGHAPNMWNARVADAERRGFLTEICVHYDVPFSATFHVDPVWIYTVRVNGRTAKRTIARDYTDRDVIYEAVRVLAKIVDEEADKILV